MIELSRKQIAALRGCDPTYVSQLKLEKTPGGKYDLLNPEIWEFVTAKTVKEAISQYKKTALARYEDNTMEGLKAEERRANIALKRKRERDLDMKYATEKMILVPSKLVGIWIGYFASGIRNNFLTIAARVSKDNKQLRNKIEKEITKGIVKTLDTAEKELMRHAEEMAASVRSHD